MIRYSRKVLTVQTWDALSLFATVTELAVTGGSRGWTSGRVFRNALRRVSGNSGVAASSESPSLKSRTEAARSRSRRRTISANLVFAEGSSTGWAGERTLLRECGFLIHASPLDAVKTCRRGTHERCGPGGWPGPHFILDFSCHGFSRIRTDHANFHITATPPHLHLKIRFLFSYTEWARMRPKKFLLFRVFRRCCATSTSLSRLVSPSPCKADLISR